MLGLIILIVILLAGVPGGVYGARWAFTRWSNNRDASCAGFLTLILLTIVYVLLWLYGLGVAFFWIGSL